MFSYDQFKILVKTDGLARQNRFYIQISMPNLKGDNNLFFQPMGSTQKRDLHLLCKSVTVPGVNVVTSPIRYTGETFEAPYDRTFGGANFTFFVDRGFYIKKFFDNWIDTIQDPHNRTMGYYNDFISDIKVVVLDKQSKERYSITLRDAHPKSVGSVNLAQDTNDIMTLDVTFDFHYYLTEMLQGGETSESARLPSYQDEGELARNDFYGYQENIESILTGGLDNNTGIDIGELLSIGEPSFNVEGIKSTALSSLRGAVALPELSDPISPFRYGS